MAVNKVELVIDELYETIIEYNAEKTYHKLYQDFDEKFKAIFVYFHSEFNQLFSFMNEKNKSNKHFNAEPSRQLINIIRQLNDFNNVLIGSEKQIEINEKYLATIKRCESFLNASGGSAIPEDLNLVEIIKYEPIFAMANNQMVRVNEDIYNLLVSLDENAWEAGSCLFDVSRYLEYTDQDLRDKFAKLGKVEINEIMKYPCIFAYEDSCEKDASVGYITDIIVRQGKIKITFDKKEVLSLERLRELKFELDIRDWELNRTHWAIKKVNLFKELRSVSTIIKLVNQPIDITKQVFDVSFTFAGETRGIVEPVVRELEKLISKDKIFYDNNFKGQLARPSLDILLQDIYRNRSKLNVVFLCEKYQEKEWCGLEWKAIRELLMGKEEAKIMYIRLDKGHVDGVFKTDGYLDGTKHTPQELANYINERQSLLS